jgi:hypothetical protein
MASQVVPLYSLLPARRGGYEMIMSRSNQVIIYAKIATDTMSTKIYENSMSNKKDTISMSGSIEKTVIQGEA